MKRCPLCTQTFDDRYTVCPIDETELMADTGDPLLGRLLDHRYRLTKKIGEGGMGSIYKAVHTEMGRTCAIKLLAPITTGREEALARDRKSTRLNSSHRCISYAVFCLKKKKRKTDKLGATAEPH